MERLAETITAALQPGSFFTSPSAHLELKHIAKGDVPWEVYHGHLLDASATRERHAMQSWLLHWGLPGQAGPRGPVLWVRRGLEQPVLYVGRGLAVHAWEAYEEAPETIGTRPVQRWNYQLVGRLELAPQLDQRALRRQLDRLLFLAVIGNSRLPITAVESPLPAFVFGQLLYLPSASPASAPLSDPLALVGRLADEELGLVERAKVLETILRAAAPEKLGSLADAAVEQWRRQGSHTAEFMRLMRAMFNYLALSPYTDFPDRLIAWLRRLAQPQLLGTPRVVDLVSYMLRQLVRHLTAFDLVKFHQRGANYPDALMLDALLQYYLELFDQQPRLFQGQEGVHVQHARHRRRALRQALLMRRHYQGLRVPDAPTSTGESTLVLPSAPVPQEQIEDPRRREKRLYDDRPLPLDRQSTAQRLFIHSLTADLAQPEELMELGIGLFLDRPLGVFKAPGEVDRTPLLSYLAYSRAIAKRRLVELSEHHDVQRELVDRGLEQLDELSVAGLPAARLLGLPRPGVVALEDALQAAGDFVFISSIRPSVVDALKQYDFTALRATAPDHFRWLISQEPLLLIRTYGLQQIRQGAPLLTAFDQQMLPRLEFAAADPVSGELYGEFAGREFLMAGLQLTAVWEEGKRCELQGVFLRPQPGT